MTRFRALLRLVIRPQSPPQNGNWPQLVKWEVIQAFDPIECFAWGDLFGSWENGTASSKGTAVRSLDFDTYRLVEYHPTCGCKALTNPWL